MITKSIIASETKVEMTMQWPKSESSSDRVTHEWRPGKVVKYVMQHYPLEDAIWKLF